MPIQISDVVDALDSGDFEAQYVYDRENDELVWVTDDEIRQADTDDEEFEEAVQQAPGWQEESLRTAKRILDSEKDSSQGDAFVSLPSQWDIHMHSIMEDFVLTLPESEQQRRLWDVLHHSKAFRRFKDAIYRYDLSDAWYRYRDDRLAEIARGWAKENNIQLT